jgi:hypothetical protein
MGASQRSEEPGQLKVDRDAGVTDSVILRRMPKRCSVRRAVAFVLPCADDTPALFPRNLSPAWSGRSSGSSRWRASSRCLGVGLGALLHEGSGEGAQTHQRPCGDHGWVCNAAMVGGGPRVIPAPFSARRQRMSCGSGRSVKRSERSRTTGRICSSRQLLRSRRYFDVRCHDLCGFGPAISSHHHLKSASHA